MSTPTDYEFTPPPTHAALNYTYSQESSQTRKLETQRRHVAERRGQLLREIIDMEVRMGLVDRWQPSSKEFTDTMRYVRTREYHRALDNLQRLVIQRLFELHNLNLAQTGNVLISIY